MEIARNHCEKQETLSVNFKGRPFEIIAIYETLYEQDRWRLVVHYWLLMRHLTQSVMPEQCRMLESKLA